MNQINYFSRRHPQIANFIGFGNRTLIATGIGAGIGAWAAKSAGAAAIGPAAIMGAAAGFISKPADMLIDRLYPVDGKLVMAQDGIGVDCIPGYIKLNPTLKLINHVVTNVAVWGGAVALGAVSLPVAGVVGGACIANSAINFSANILLNTGWISKKTSVLLSAALKIGVIAGAATGLVFLGVVAPPVAITTGVALGIIVIGLAIIKLAPQNNVQRFIEAGRNLFPAVTLVPTSM